MYGKEWIEHLEKQETIRYLSRPMTGLFAALTPEQRQRALEYDGPVNSGTAAFEKVTAHTLEQEAKFQRNHEREP